MSSGETYKWDAENRLIEIDYVGVYGEIPIYLRWLRAPSHRRGNRLGGWHDDDKVREHHSMTDYPTVSETDGSVLVEFCPVGKHLPGKHLNAVVDFGQGGEIVGIEIINLALKAGKNSLQVNYELPNGDGTIRIK